jgi:hypothetical protein
MMTVIHFLASRLVHNHNSYITYKVFWEVFHLNSDVHDADKFILLYLL